MSEEKQLWVVGKVFDTPACNVWEMCGVYDNLEVALQTIRDYDGDEYFIGPILMNETMPEESHEWPLAYYPKLQDQPDGFPMS